ncbi:MAG TPA: lysophospholipid acyltransferase family protein [Acetobacteraceae bacterium]|jgi:hypothetical protein|nr:lysophospholipid acyltransferase family protein [Acetobacteraceae bacterium]
MKWLVQRRVVQALLTGLLGRYLEFTLRTTRWTVEGGEHLASVLAGGPMVFASWHERLPLMTALWLYARTNGSPAQVYVLVSRHRDGRFIGEVMRRFSFRVVHGSSISKGRDRGGAAGALTMLSCLADGQIVGITPDGPRGPARVAAPGVAQLAAVSGVPVLPCAAQTSRRIVAPTWDRMIVPLPFGRGTIVCGAPISVARDGAEAALPVIAQALTAAADRADRLGR